MAERLKGRPIKSFVFELALLASGALGVLALFRIRFALVFWRKLRLFAFLYVGGIIVLAVIQLLFHVRM